MEFVQPLFQISSTDELTKTFKYFTGSREHNIEVRKMAQKMGYKVNEKGIYKGAKKVGGTNEEDIYNILGIPMPAPVDR